MTTRSVGYQYIASPQPHLLPLLGGADVPLDQSAPASALDRWLAPVTDATYWGFFPSGGSTAIFDQMEAQGQRPFAISKQYYDLNAGRTYPSASHAEHARGGRCIHIALALRAPGATNPLLPEPAGTQYRNYTYAQVNNGSMDAFFRDLARQLRSVPNPFLFDINHEPENQVGTVGRPQSFSDALWYPNRAANGLATTQRTLREYADAVRRIIGILKSEGVVNAIFVMSYAAVGSNGTGYDPYYGALYPGDDVIDLIAWDPYNALNSTSNWGTPAQTWSTGYNKFTRGLLDTAPFYPGTNAKNKPFMLSEYGCGPDASDSTRRPNWLGQIEAATESLPKIKAIQYYSSLGSSTNGGTNIHDYPADRAAFGAEGLKARLLTMPPTR